VAIDNASLFADSVAALHEEGRALLLFPEGISYTLSSMQPLKTGAARVAQELLQKHGESIPIVPVGLNYVQKEKFRSNVLVEFGPPLRLDPTIADAKEQVRELTHRLDKALHDLTINAPDFDTLLDLRIARLILADGRVLNLEQSVGLTRRMAAFYEDKKSEPQIQELKYRVSEYRKRLEELSISGAANFCTFLVACF
jgi:glycerol-3-phosphate O-acyltransferase/dihydroxyacetone phosphate acyltransferase